MVEVSERFAPFAEQCGVGDRTRKRQSRLETQVLGAEVIKELGFLGEFVLEEVVYQALPGGKTHGEARNPLLRVPVRFFFEKILEQVELRPGVAVLLVFEQALKPHRVGEDFLTGIRPVRKQLRREGPRVQVMFESELAFREVGQGFVLESLAGLSLYEFPGITDEVFERAVAMKRIEELFVGSLDRAFGRVAFDQAFEGADGLLELLILHRLLALFEKKPRLFRRTGAGIQRLGFREGTHGEGGKKDSDKKRCAPDPHRLGSSLA